MAYSKDLRSRVVKYVRQGNSKAEAARRFDVGLWTIYAWLRRGDDQTPQKPGPKGASKIGMKKLAAMVGERGTDLMLKEIAKEFRVHKSTVSKAMQRLGISRKKTTRYAEAEFYEKSRRRFLKQFYKATQEGCDILYLDETGFAPTVYRTHA